jgi:AcrR family transcriptional regulator
MARRYELKRRAELQEETRRRIVEAAVDLHRTKGPARTSLSEVARRAGVQRNTLYRHFSDERELFMACSGLYMELNPPPDPIGWLALAEPADRLRRGLTELYAFYERTEDMLASILRDSEIDPLTREMFELRAGGTMMEIRRVLGEPLQSRRAVAALDVAIDFHAWQSLAASGLSRDEAVETMITAVLAQ